jgi:hypothetical protein
MGVALVGILIRTSWERSVQGQIAAKSRSKLHNRQELFDLSSVVLVFDPLSRRILVHFDFAVIAESI